MYNIDLCILSLCWFRSPWHAKCRFSCPMMTGSNTLNGKSGDECTDDEHRLLYTLQTYHTTSI
jgi:hypothetical protein